MTRCEINVRSPISTRRYRTAQLDITAIDTLIRLVIVLGATAVFDQLFLDQSHFVALIHEQTSIGSLHSQLSANRMLYHLTSNHAAIVQIDHIAIALRHSGHRAKQYTNDQ